MVRALLLALLGLGAIACGARDAAHEPEQGPSGTAVRVASVNGESIASDEVLTLCRATGLSAQQALERLVAARLLVQHARARGYDRSPEVVRGAAQARVQQLLSSAVERGSDPTQVAARQRRLEALLGELMRRTQVKYDEDAIAKLFAAAPP